MSEISKKNKEIRTISVDPDFYKDISKMSDETGISISRIFCDGAKDRLKVYLEGKSKND